MTSKLSITVVGGALSTVFAATYVVCVSFGLLSGPAMMSTMSPAIGMMSVGLGWTVGGILIGLVTSVLFGFWIAVIFVPVYNYLQERETVADASKTIRSR
jgi:hypothetical protein